jgi:hypothetical protein
MLACASTVATVLGRRRDSMLWTVCKGTLIGLVVAVGVAACGGTTASSTTTTPSQTVQDEQSLESSINAEAKTSAANDDIASSVPITTQCTPTTPDLDYWSCTTSLMMILQPAFSSEDGPCNIVTKVTTGGSNWTWSQPVVAVAYCT